jgi:lysophospholipase L1-like esterase
MRNLPNFRHSTRLVSLIACGLLSLLGCSSSTKETESNQGGTLVATAGTTASSGAGVGGSVGTQGGQSSGGTPNGGQPNGGRANGGTPNGGQPDGGTPNGGQANGGQPNGGAPNGGQANGGRASGGQANGGRASGGAASGGRTNGGNSNAGQSSGGTPGGGQPSGGASGSGQPAGGQNSGGAAPGVRIVGRTAPGTSGTTRFQWSGVSVQARFRGTQVSIQLEDGGNKNEFTVVIDGVVKPNLVTVSGKTSYQLATGLADTTHDLVVWRRLEAYYNPTEFIGLSDFGTGGALLEPPAAPDRRIEIIGDSITCGYGNEGTAGCTGTKPENNYLAYGSVAARLVGADLHTIAWSGIGMYRNYGENGPSTDTMPARYDLALPTVTGSTWDFNKFVPQAVVINMGTNDFSTKGEPGQPYIDAYIKFVQHVRSVYPQAYVFCLIPLTSATNDINQVVSTLKTAGDSQIEAFDNSVTTGGTGCDGHPDVAMHKAMGEKLAAELKRVLSW